MAAKNDNKIIKRVLGGGELSWCREGWDWETGALLG